MVLITFVERGNIVSFTWKIVWKPVVELEKLASITFDNSFNYFKT